MSAKVAVTMAKKTDKQRIYDLERKVAKLEKFIANLEAMNYKEAIYQAHRTRGLGPIDPVYGEELF